MAVGWLWDPVGGRVPPWVTPLSPPVPKDERFQLWVAVRWLWVAMGSRGWLWDPVGWPWGGRG